MSWDDSAAWENQSQTSEWAGEDMEWSSDPISSRFAIEYVGGKKKRRCLYPGCNKYYSFNGSHTALKRHWLKEHEAATSEKRTAFTFADDEADDAIVKMVINEQLEYNFVKKPSFINAMRCGGPDKTFISRANLSDTIIAKTVELKKSVVDILDREISVALTFDIWTAENSSTGYGCVTGHFIDSEFNMQSAILEFKHLPFPHDTQCICDFLKHVIYSFRIQSKVVSITTDSASNNISGISKLKNECALGGNFSTGFLHFRCVAHIIHGAVRKALDRFSPAIRAIRGIITTIRGSVKRVERFEKITEEYINDHSGRTSLTRTLKLKVDLEIRWNSTFIMLERAVLLQGPITRALVLIPELVDQGPIDWVRIMELIRFLKPFYEVTERLCGTNYATISLINTSVPKLITFLEREEFSDELIASAARALLDQLQLYHEHLTQDLVYLATVLDPRIKLHTIAEEAQGFVRQLLADSLDPDNRSHKVT